MKRCLRLPLQPLHSQTVFRRSPEEPSASAEIRWTPAKNDSHMRGKEAQLAA